MAATVIRSRTHAILYEGIEAEPIREAVERAVRSGANLTRADLTRANLTRADLAWADLTRANLTWANLTRADLTEADLTGADLTGANLTGANLTRADLTWADLTRANLTRADLTWADLTEADLTGANLTGAIIDGPDTERREISALVASGALLEHRYLALRMTDGGILLQYGCEMHDLAEWPHLLRALCEKHVPDHAAQHEEALLGLLDRVRAIAGDDGEAE
uniref:Pentapeptide repeat-containing protein n=1 Tax=viral metagenome TaxID=1070528 RepID=A0A6M3X800_9ZZZZ